MFAAYRNYLLVRLNRVDEITLAPSVLPNASQVNPRDAGLVVEPYVAAHRFDDALRFLYAQLREYFEEEQAHGAYFSFFLTYEKMFSILEPSESVTDDCAVLLTSCDNGQRWVVIENDGPLASRDELPTTNELSQRLLGHKVGDTVELPGNLIQADKATIQEIQSKYVRAFQDCLENFRRRFPDTSTLQKIHVGTADNFDPSTIVESLKGRREYVEECLRLYVQSPCSLYLFARRVGTSEVRAIRYLERHERGFVRCCQTTPDRFDDAANSGFSTHSIVLDLSAIITLTFLDAWSCLANDYQYLVSQLTSERIDGWLNEARHRQTEQDRVAMLDDSEGLVMREASEEQRDQDFELLKLMRNMVDQCCQLKPSPMIASIDPEKRNLYKEALGMHNLEAIGVASESDGVLWSDDVVVGFASKDDFGVDHVWTQLALRRFQLMGAMTAPAYDLATAKLASWSYAAIVWNANTLIAASEEAKWDAEAWPLKHCLALIQKSEDGGITNPQIVLEFIKLLRRSSCIELRQSVVIQATLDAIGSVQAVRWMLRKIDTMFMVDITSAEFVRLELQYWLSRKVQE